MTFAKIVTKTWGGSEETYKMKFATLNCKEYFTTNNPNSTITEITKDAYYA